MTRNNKSAAHSDGSYEVGYGKPPRHSRWQPGVSGNRKGRPKAQPKTEDIFAKLFRRTTTVRMGGTEMRVRMIEAIAFSLFNMALKEGKLPAHKLLLDIHAKLGAASDRAAVRFSDADLEILADLQARIAQDLQSSGSEPEGRA